jgi:hypothetical protein
MDFTTNGIAHNIIDHAPLIVGLAVVMWWLFPKMLNVALRNGSGVLIGEIVGKQLVEQNKDTDKMIKDHIQAHERVEAEGLRSALLTIKDEIETDGREEFGKLERRLDRYEIRIAAIESKLFKRARPRGDEG